VSAVNETIVREYFEGLGFLVNLLRKHGVPARPKTAEEEIDLLVVNPRAGENRLPDRLVWTAADLKTVARAVVAVRGWHTERFYPSTFEQQADILKFVEAEPLRFARKTLGSGPLAKVLCLPRFAQSPDLRNKALEALKARGVDGVITFETILAELVARVDVSRNYERSDTLQLLRILKCYDLFRDSQLELFSGRRRARTGGKTAAPARPDAVPPPPETGEPAGQG
jgi:hypothetical protein